VTWRWATRPSRVPPRCPVRRSLPRESAQEKLSTSPQRKLVKFFARSRNQGKAKSHVAKTVRKRLGTRRRRGERSHADYPQQRAALQTQVAEGRAKHAQTGRELEELKKKYPQLRAAS
jgi:hypothetical protein